MPPRGPRSVLCVVEVTKSASGTGEGCKPVATSPGNVREIDHQRGADLVGDLAKRLVFHDPRIGARSGNDELGAVFERFCAHFVEVDQLGILLHAVRDRVVQLAGEAHLRSVGEVAAVRERHAEHGIAGLQKRHEDRHVRLRAGVRLDVRVLGRRRAACSDRLRASPRRQPIRSRRSSAFRDSLRRTCWSSRSPWLRGPPGLRNSPRRSVPGSLVADAPHRRLRRRSAGLALRSRCARECPFVILR